MESPECLLVAMVCISGGMGIALMMLVLGMLAAQAFREILKCFCREGLSLSQIQQLPRSCKSMAESNDTEECAVCLQQFQRGETCITLQPCGHFFHYKCAAEWLFLRPICPLCRATVIPTTSAVAEEGDSRLQLPPDIP
eukprot:TRINITY_DN31331_c0_g1_i1.p1 TRINITY_DN31331_c0_g1~~TRINITY_DN31331_c0_g1_i1.p1  ORF type:complete len:139 (+),score=27.52 TRINITY_DN31331_c0_g1_i1:15-431(+)